MTTRFWIITPKVRLNKCAPLFSRVKISLSHQAAPCVIGTDTVRSFGIAYHLCRDTDQLPIPSVILEWKDTNYKAPKRPARKNHCSVIRIQKRLGLQINGLEAGHKSVQFTAEPRFRLSTTFLGMKSTELINEWTCGASG